MDARRQIINFNVSPCKVPAYNPFGRPGGGAPHVTHEGKVKYVNTKDPELRFQRTLRKEVENTMVRK